MSGGADSADLLPVNQSQPQTPDDPTLPPCPAPGPGPGGLQGWLDAHPWHPRFAPLLLYVIFLSIIGWARSIAPSSYPVLYAVQCIATALLIYRYRRFVPEISFSFHWLLIPIAIGAATAWIGLALMMAHLWPDAFGSAGKSFFDEMPAPVAWISLAFRLLGMSLLVPVVEELFFRSALMRSLHKPRPALYALVHFAEGLPIIGPMVLRSKISQEADAQTRPLADMFHATPLGAISPFSLLIVPLLWCVLSHTMRDWPGTIVCGLAYAWLCYITNRPGRTLGLGPVIWAHGLTNAILWGYTLATGDWRFL